MSVTPKEKHAFIMLVHMFFEATVQATKKADERGGKGAVKRERRVAKMLLKYYLGNNVTEADVDAVIGG